MHRQFLLQRVESLINRPGGVYRTSGPAFEPLHYKANGFTSQVLIKASGFVTILATLKPEDIRTFRKKHELSQQVLGDLLGVHWMTVSRWERDINASDARAIPPFLHLALETLEARLAKKKKSK